MHEGVEAGKKQQGQHGTQGHDIVEYGTQITPLHRGCCGGGRGLDVPAQFSSDQGHILGLVQAVCEILWGMQRGVLELLSLCQVQIQSLRAPWSPVPPLSPEWLS